MNTNGTVSVETRSLEDYRNYLRQVTAIQSEAVRRLVSDDGTSPLEMAAVLEDIANIYLNISDEIRDVALGRSSNAMPSP